MVRVRVLSVLMLRCCLIVSRILDSCGLLTRLVSACRLLEIAPHYYDMENFPDCEAKLVFKRVIQRKELAKRQQAAYK